MSFFRRRTTVDVEDSLDRLRSLSAECSGAGIEEEDARQVEQTASTRPAQDQKVYCCECHLSFGLAEPKVPVVGQGVAHRDCHEKIVRREQQRIARFDAFLTRTVH